MANTSQSFGNRPVRWSMPYARSTLFAFYPSAKSTWKLTLGWKSTRLKATKDHMIIAHAITNRMPLISSDQKFKFYEKQGLELVFNER